MSQWTLFFGSVAGDGLSREMHSSTLTKNSARIGLNRSEEGLNSKTGVTVYTKARMNEREEERMRSRIWSVKLASLLTLARTTAGGPLRGFQREICGAEASGGSVRGQRRH
jgi:hypothetical protein